MIQASADGRKSIRACLHNRIRVNPLAPCIPGAGLPFGGLSFQREAQLGESNRARRHSGIGAIAALR